MSDFLKVYLDQLNADESADEAAPVSKFSAAYLDLLADHAVQPDYPLAHLFDASWYRKIYRIEADQDPLVHYLTNRHTYRFSPNPAFDTQYYAANNPDVVAAGADAFEHYIFNGANEGRWPSARFDSAHYQQTHMQDADDEMPFLHYLRNFDLLDASATYTPSVHELQNVGGEVKYFTKPGPDFEEVHPLPSGLPLRGKILAYYLPQFHSFPENDAWWGKGFTEWTNVARGMPRFKGHYQPRVPRDLGFYNLNDPATMRRQAEMAKAAGVHGFVFYHYWFDGKRLMEKPLEAFLADRSIDIPFALMWANENWSRRWDGSEQEILIAQHYRADDDGALVAEYAKYFADPRYIRLEDNRPLLMIYRPGIIPNAKELIARWRKIFQDQFRENPIMVMIQGFDDLDPEKYGFDGAVEFPPHKVAANLSSMIPSLQMLDSDFSGEVLSYDDVVTRSLREPPPKFPLIKGIMPAWDNDARRQGSGMTLHGSTPAKYEAWLNRLIDRARENPFFGEALVVINAWNEWAEGTYLEPDLHFGGAYLNATGRAAAGLTRVHQGNCKLLLIGHDANPHGAQELLLHIGRALRDCFGVTIEYLLLEGGPIEHQYEALAKTVVAVTPDERRVALQSACDRGFTCALANTAVAANIVPMAEECGIACVNLIHELPRIIGERRMEPAISGSFDHARAIVFPAPFVRDAVMTAVKPETIRAKIVVQPQGIYKPITRDDVSGAKIRAEFSMSEGDHLVLGMGFGDLRKGFDLFLQLWRQTNGIAGPRVHFCWLGLVDIGLRQWLSQEIEDAIAEGSFHLPGFSEAVAGYYSAASVLALTSREDPFPSVVLEALSAGVPVVAFARSGGIPDMLLQHGLGTVVPYSDVAAMAGAINNIVTHPPKIDTAAQRDLLAREFDWGTYVWRLLTLARPEIAAVTVAVPNYNYARYMAARLGSIFSQDYPLRELLVLDDCSTDDSLTLIPQIAAEWSREITLVPNEVNSGSVFAQWRKAAMLAKGEFLWIAEADDLSEPEFLSALVEALRNNPKCCFAFSDSSAIDATGKPLGASYKSYYASCGEGSLTKSEVFEAGGFVARFLSVRNLILNVSAVVWRRDALLAALDRCSKALPNFKLAGDWLLYLTALAEPGAQVAYEARPLNTHRRDAGGVTHSMKPDQHVAEIAAIHQTARELFELASEVVAGQDKYLADVAVQLGATVAAPRKAKKSKK